MSEQETETRTQAKNWCLTINNWTPTDLTRLEAYRQTYCSYFIYEFERAPTTGTPHIQGYFQLKSKDRQSGIKTKWGATNISIRIARGDPQSNVAYCSKEGSPIIWPEHATPDDLEIAPRRQGQRTDLADAIKANPTLNSFMDSHPELYCRFRNGLRDIYNLARERATKIKPKVHWLAGPTGCGKTRIAYGAGEDVWISSILPWFDGYVGQKVAILDDYRSGDLPFNRLLRILDRYPIQATIKNGSTTWNPHTIFITCPRLPAQEFVRHQRDINGNPDNETYEDVGQIERRCDTIRQFNTILQEWIWIKGNDYPVEAE